MKNKTLPIFFGTCFVIAILIIMIVAYNKTTGEPFQIFKRPCLKKMEKSCYNDPLTTAKCWTTKDFPCPYQNGSYQQCTNNFKHDVNIANCLERSYYYSADDERLSERCVYGKTGKVYPFAVKQNIPNPYKPSIFPRVNVFRNDEIDNNFFVNL